MKLGKRGMSKKLFSTLLTLVIIVASAAMAIPSAASVPLLPYDLFILEQTPSWGWYRIGVSEAWETTQGEGIKVAVLDTGCGPHSDLIIVGGYDFVNNDDDPRDDHGHGTHCAGIVSALDNGYGVVGVAQVEIYAVKMLDSAGFGSWEDATLALEWCIDNGMDVVSMSWGGFDSDPAFEAVVREAYGAGLVLVAAAGNMGGQLGDDYVLYPARLPEIIAVAATDGNDEKAIFSSVGPAVEIAAPGVNIYSCYLNGEYMFWSGTSMACPHVAGVSALILSSSNLTNEMLRWHLYNTATDLGVEGWDPLYGYGLVDASKAVSEHYCNITLTPIQPQNQEIVRGTIDVQLLVEHADSDIVNVTFRFDSLDEISLASSDSLWYTTFDTSLLEDGSHTITFKVNTVYGLAKTKTIHVSTYNLVELFNIDLYDRSWEGGDLLAGSFVSFKLGITDYFTGETVENSKVTVKVAYVYFWGSYYYKSGTVRKTPYFFKLKMKPNDTKGYYTVEITVLKDGYLPYVQEETFRYMSG